MQYRVVALMRFAGPQLSPNTSLSYRIWSGLVMGVSIRQSLATSILPLLSSRI